MSCSLSSKKNVTFQKTLNPLSELSKRDSFGGEVQESVAKNFSFDIHVAKNWENEKLRNNFYVLKT